MPTWYDPQTWTVGETATAAKLNKIMEDLRYLKAPNSVSGLVRGTGSNATSTSLTLANVDANFTGLTMTTTGQGPIRLRLDCVLQTTAVNNFLFDVLIDGTTYASSMTNTAVTNNLWAPRGFVISVPFQVDLVHTIPAGALVAGVHTFTLQWRTSAAATMTMFLAAYVAQFSVTE